MGRTMKLDHYIIFFSLPFLVVTDDALVFVGPGFGSYCDVELLDLHSDSSVDCDIPHYPYYEDNPNYNDFGGPVGAVINDMVTLCAGVYQGLDQVPSFDSVDECYFYDPSTKSWEHFPSLFKERSVDVTLSDGRWWTVSGLLGGWFDKSTEIFADGVWLPGPDLPFGWVVGCGAQVGPNITLLVGGYDDVIYGTPNYTNRAWMYDWETSLYEEIMPLSEARNAMACIAVDDRTLMVTGGYTSQHGSFDTVEVFNMDTRSWTIWDPLPTPVKKHTMVRDGDEVLLLGGFEGGLDEQGSGKIYRFNEEN